jgi:protease-4
MTKRQNPIIRLLKFIWRGLDRFRRLVHLLLMLMVFAIVVAGLAGERVRVPSSAALMVAPSGVLVNQLEGDALERAYAELRGDGARQTLVRDLTASLEAAAGDDRIKVVVLDLDDFEGGGLAKLQTVASAIRGVRDTGKKVIAIGDSFTQDQYYLAANADEIYLHDLGFVFIDGYGYYRAFFKTALDKLRVDLNVFRVGEFKSFVEPFTRDDMSSEDKEASERWLSALWESYQNDVIRARKLEPGALDDYANDLVPRLRAAGGDTAQTAVDAGLVDDLISKQEFSDMVISMVGESEQKPGTYSSITFRDYLKTMRAGEALRTESANVGVIVAAGQIVDGEAPPGTVGGDSLAALVREAASDESVKALVLQVDSPGGSMFASEVVFDQLEELKAAGKPLIVSMSSVAASGGYYIAMLADQIWANETTVTGSIGVGALIPTFQRGLSNLGVNVDGFGTTNLAGQFRPDRELGSDARELVQATIEQAYRLFVQKVADSRGMSFDRADSVARGRVWIGSDAFELGLVDQLGGVEDAIAAAADKAGLEDGKYGIKYLQKQLTIQERLALEFAVRIRLAAQTLGLLPDLTSNGLLGQLVDRVGREFEPWARLNDPRGIYYHCFCDIP